MGSGSCCLVLLLTVQVISTCEDKWWSYNNGDLGCPCEQNPGPMVPLGPPGLMDPPGPPDQMDPPGPPGHMDPPGPLGSMVPPGPPDSMVPQEPFGPLVHPEPPSPFIPPYQSHMPAPPSCSSCQRSPIIIPVKYVPIPVKILNVNPVNNHGTSHSVSAPANRFSFNCNYGSGENVDDDSTGTHPLDQVLRPSAQQQSAQPPTTLPEGYQMHQPNYQYKGKSREDYSSNHPALSSSQDKPSHHVPFTPSQGQNPRNPGKQIPYPPGQGKYPGNLEVRAPYAPCQGEYPGDLEERFPYDTNLVTQSPAMGVSQPEHHSSDDIQSPEKNSDREEHVLHSFHNNERGDGVIDSHPGAGGQPGDNIPDNMTPSSYPNIALCAKHYIVRTLRPVYDECIQKVPVLQKVIRHEPVTTFKTISVKRKVYNKPVRCICQVPIVEKLKVSNFQYKTKMVPYKKIRIVPKVETFVVNVPVTEKVEEPLYKNVVRHEPRICYRMKPVVQEKLVQVPVTTKCLRPVVVQRVITVPVKSCIRKDLVEQRVEKTYEPC